MNCLGNVLKTLLLKFGHKSVFMELLEKLEFTLNYFLENSTDSKELVSRERAEEVLTFARALKRSILDITGQ